MIGNLTIGIFTKITQWINMSENLELTQGRTANKPYDPVQWRPGTSIQLKDDYSTSMFLEDVSKAGMHYIELAWRNEMFNMLDIKNMQWCAQFIQDARNLGLEVWSLHLPYGPDWDVSVNDATVRKMAIAQHMQLIQLANQWDIGTVVIHPSWEPIKENERNDRLAFCKNSLSMMAVAAESLNVRIAVECLPRTCLGNTSEEMLNIISIDERLGVCCDVNHLLQEAPEEFIHKLGPRIISVHMSDNDGNDERHWVPGNGIIRWNRVIEALASQGYMGAFMFEARPTDPFELMQCWERLKGKR